MLEATVLEYYSEYDDKMKNFLDIIPMKLMMLDPQGSITYINKAAMDRFKLLEEHIGPQIEKLIGQDVSLIHQDIKKAQQSFQQTRDVNDIVVKFGDESFNFSLCRADFSDTYKNHSMMAIRSMTENMERERENAMVDANGKLAYALKQATDANSMVSELGKFSGKIGDMIKAISSVAGQTTFLALNATIEAAKAGDAGKGFAVVAGEVKELAKQTTKVAWDITKMIERMQRDTAHVVDVIGEIPKAIKQADIRPQTKDLNSRQLAQKLEDLSKELRIHISKFEG